MLIRRASLPVKIALPPLVFNCFKWFYTAILGIVLTKVKQQRIRRKRTDMCGVNQLLERARLGHIHHTKVQRRTVDSHFDVRDWLVQQNVMQALGLYSVM